MPFAVVSGVRLGMGVLDFGGDRRRGRGSLGVNLRRPMGMPLRHCVIVLTAIELSFGVVSGVGQGNHVLDGSPRASRETGCFCRHGLRHFSKFSSNT